MIGQLCHHSDHLTGSQGSDKKKLMPSLSERFVWRDDPNVFALNPILNKKKKFPILKAKEKPRPHHTQLEFEG